MSGALIHEVLTSKDGKMNFLGGLIKLSKVDGQVSDNEKIFFNSAAISLGLEEADIAQLNQYWDVEMPPLGFETKREGLFFLREAIQLCHADGRYGDEEKVMIKAFSSELNVKPDTLAQIENWVEEGIQWSLRGQDLIDLEG